MKTTTTPPALAEAGTYRQVFRQGEAVLLTAAARWPRLEETSPGIRRVNRYYDALFDRWRRRWEGPLLEQAKAAAGPESPPWSAQLDFTVTHFSDGLFSLYIDVVEETASRPRRIRLGDIWSLPAGVPVTLRELLPRRRWWRGPVMEAIRAQVGQRVQAGESIYYEDWPRLVSTHFSPQRAYLTEQGPTVFYPQETIAPSLEGFPTFSLAALCPPVSPPEEATEAPGTL